MIIKWKIIVITVKWNNENNNVIIVVVSDIIISKKREYNHTWNNSLSSFGDNEIMKNSSLEAAKK